MSRMSMVLQAIGATVTVLGLVLVVVHSSADAASARTAKDAGERAKAVATAARHLQGAGFIDPMLAAENVNDSQLSVEVDHKSWSRMDKGQKLEFLDRLNGGVLNANGGIAIDMYVSMNGSKVAASTFSGGQQVMRLLE